MTSVRSALDADWLAICRRAVGGLEQILADAPTMADVVFAFVYDFGPREEWCARRGEGAFLNGERLDETLGERRGHDGRLEVVGIESADPRWLAAAADPLRECCYRVRALG